MTEEQNPITYEPTRIIKTTVIILLVLLLVLCLYLLSEAPVWVLMMEIGMSRNLLDIHNAVYDPAYYFYRTPIEPILMKWWGLWIPPEGNPYLVIIEWGF